jgi:RNA polymerase sigma-70 factor (ECF subfamily)
MPSAADSMFELAAAPRYMAPLAKARGAAAAAVGAGSGCVEQPDDENELMARIGRADGAAYRVMSDRYLARVAGFAQRLLGNRSEAEDVAQDVFLKLWTEAGRWTARAKPSTWLYRVAHNLSIDRLRKRRQDDPSALDRHSAGDRPSTLLSRKETAQQVAAALATLPDRQRVAITLVHYEGLGNAEAAEVLEVSVEALESLLSRARRNLREQLDNLREQMQGELK